jgi:hypothetical protein
LTLFSYITEVYDYIYINSLVLITSSSTREGPKKTFGDRQQHCS